MKAIVLHQYGGPEVLKFEDYPDPVLGPGQVLVRVAAASVNPIDYKRRAGLTKEAAALPLATTTGNQLLSATGIKAGQTVLVVGAAGNVGRSAVFTAKQLGATVIAGVLKKQMDEAKTVGADQVVATDDDTAIANLSPLDAVADAVGGRTAEKLIAKVEPGGVYASVVGAPQNAAKYPSVKVVHVFSRFDRKTLEFMAEAVRDGKLVIPISEKLPLSKAAEAQAAAEKGGVGKILLVA